MQSILGLGTAFLALASVRYVDGTKQSVLSNQNVIALPGSFLDAATTYSKRSLVATSTKEGRVDVFAIGQDNALWHVYWDSSSTSATKESLSGDFIGPPSVASPSPGVLDVVGLGSDHAAWISHHTNESSERPWKSLGGQFTAVIATAAKDSDQTHIVGWGTDSSYRHTILDRNSEVISDWKTIGRAFVSEPTAVSWGPNNLHVIGRRDDQAFYHYLYDGSWTFVKYLDGRFLGPASVASLHNNNLEVFGVGLDLSTYHKYFQHGAWDNDWEDLGGNAISSLEVKCTRFFGVSRIDIFQSDNSGSCYTRGWTANSWDGWRGLGNPVTSRPAVVSLGNKFHIVGLGGPDNALYYKTRDGTVYWPSDSTWAKLGGSFRQFNI